MTDLQPTSPSQESDDEFVWRFQLSEGEQPAVFEDPLLELIRVQWEELLKLAVPVFEGKEVKVDSFRLMRDLKTDYPIYRPEPSGPQEDQS